MNQGIPIIKEVDDLIIDGSMNMIQKAKRLAMADRKVLIAIPQTYLGTDINGSYEFYLKDQDLAFFPDETIEDDYLLPDKGKRYLEFLCEELGIDLLYGCYYIDNIVEDGKKLARFGTKGGLVLVAFDEIYELKDTNKEDFEKSKENQVVARAMLHTDGKRYELLEAYDQYDSKVSLADNILKTRKQVLNAYSTIKDKHKIQLGRFAPMSGYRKIRSKIDGESQSYQIINKDVSIRQNYGFAQAEKVILKDAVYDIVVIGGGTSGAMAALHAARNGAKTVLIEPQYDLGGTGTIGGVSTYWFGNRFKDTQEIDDIVWQWCETYGIDRGEGIWTKYDRFHPGIKSLVLLEECLKAGVQVAFGQLSYGAINRGALKGVATAGDGGNTGYFGKIIIDATGDADAAVAFGADYDYGSSRDGVTYWASLAQYTSAKSYQNNFSSMVVCSDPVDMTRFIRLGRKRGDVFDHGTYVSMRESRHIKGERTIDLRDLCTFRTYEDGLYTCFSNYDPKGKLDSDMIYCGILPPQVRVQIPLKALIPIDYSGNKIVGVYVAGKAISATHNVFPSIRMQPDLIHQGSVLGMLAAKACHENCLIEELRLDKRRAWIMEMSGDDLTLPDSYPQDLKKVVDNLTDKTRTQWIDVPFTWEECEQNQMLTLAVGSRDKVLPLLQQKISQLDGRKENQDLILRLQSLALWHGDNGGLDQLYNNILEQLISDNSKQNGNKVQLPSRSGSTACVQLLPDHGAMPELVYKMNLLAYSKRSFAMEVFQIVYERLISGVRDYEDKEAGIFHYIESFAYVAERTGDKEFVPYLKGLTGLGELQAAVKERDQVSLLAERYLILLLELRRAQACLGQREGYEGLIDLMNCSSFAISSGALKIIDQLLQVHSRDQKQILAAIETELANPQIRLIEERLW